jgi:hypothetical protein
MFDWIVSLFRWIFGIWIGLPEEIKKPIIKAIVDEWETWFREYYRASKAGGNQ